jgi:hypothetical protein
MLVTVATLLMGAFLVAAAVAKAVDRPGTVVALATYGVSGRAAHVGWAGAPGSRPAAPGRADQPPRRRVGRLARAPPGRMRELNARVDLDGQTPAAAAAGYLRAAGLVAG